MDLERFSTAPSEKNKTPTQQQIREPISDSTKAFDSIKKSSLVAVAKVANIELSIDFMCMLIAAHTDTINRKQISFLAGPPGTGKTFFAESIAPLVLKKLQSIIKEKPDTTSSSEFLKIIKDAESAGMKISAKENLLEKVANNYGSKTFNEWLSDIVDSYKMINSSDDKERLTTAIKQLLFKLAIIEKNKLVSITQKEIETHVYVLPSCETAIEIINSESYKIGGDRIISREETSPILELIKNAADGKFVILIIDEITEIPKRDIDRRPKQLHSFLDAYIKNESFQLYIKPEEVDSRTKELLNELTKKGVATDMKDGNYALNIPSTLLIFATGNIRESPSPVGLTESTIERSTPYLINYPLPNKVKEFLKEKAEGLKSVLQEKVSAETLIEFDSFVNRLSQNYEKLYKDYSNKPDEFISRMLPSYRNLDGVLKAFMAYAITRNELTNNYQTLKDAGISFGTIKVTCKTNMVGNKQYNFNEEDYSKNTSSLPSLNDFGGFLCAMVNAQTYITVGSYNDISEARGSEQIVTELSDNIMKEFNTTLNSNNRSLNDLYFIDIGNRRFYYSYPYFLYALYSISSALAGQKFFLLAGTTQEGKSTMVNSIMYNFLTAMIKTRCTPFDDLKFFAISDKNDATLIAPKIMDQKNKQVKTPRLLEIVRKADVNRNTLYFVQIDEIDSLQFSQHLNALLTRETVNVEGKEYYVGNVCIFGTTNISATMLDNFVSRSILPLLFLEDVGNAKLSGISIDKRSIVLIYDILLKATKNNKESNAIINEIMNLSEDKLKQFSFFEVAGMFSNDNTIKGLVENGLSEEVPSHIDTQLTDMIDKKNRRKDVVRGR